MSPAPAAPAAPSATRTMLGPQVSSKKASAPNYGFGSGTRETQEKVFVSPEHAALQGNPASPGPAVYSQRASVGPQVDGPKASAPEWAFGTAQRFGSSKYAVGYPAPGTYDADVGIGKQVNSNKTTLPIYGFGSSTRQHQEKVYLTKDHNKGLYGKESPGPSPYTLNPAVGNQVLSFGPTGAYRRIRNGSQPTWVVGKDARFKADRPSLAPGPGAYALSPAVGNQVTSNKPSLPRFGFGTSNRDHAAKVYISPEHAKLSGGPGCAPGPGAYPVASMTGAQVASSTKVTGSAWGFGTAKRFNDAFKHPVPGPGQYVV